VTRRILVVDDDEDIREIARLALETVGGWQVDTEPDGQAALTRAASSPPYDLILFDVMMPGMDGPTAVRRIRADGCTTPILFLTARPRDDLVDAGADGVLRKPFDPMTLAEEIRARLGWPA